MLISRLAGIGACALLIIACFMPWAWYPNLNQYFTGFISEGNHYGKPGKALVFFSVLGILFFALGKTWSMRINLILGALCLAYAVRSWLIYTTAYFGFVPQPQMGIYLMLAGAAGFLVASVVQIIIKPAPPSSAS